MCRTRAHQGHLAVKVSGTVPDTPLTKGCQTWRWIGDQSAATADGLTKQGSKKVHAGLATSAVQQSTPAADRHIVTWLAAHQTERLESDVSLSMLGAS